MIDWQQLITNLQAIGIGVTKAATLAEVPAYHLTQIVKGDTLEPPFSTGVRLLDLHLDLCPTRHEALMEDEEQAA